MTTRWPVLKSKFHQEVRLPNPPPHPYSSYIDGEVQWNGKTPVTNDPGDQEDLSKLGVGFQPLRNTAVHMLVPGVLNPGLEKEGLCL